MLARVFKAMIAPLFLTCVFAFPAVASDTPPELPTAEEVIAECWEISEALRSSQNTNDMRAGNLEMALCLEAAIVQHSSEFIDPDYLNEDKLTEKMEQLRFNIGSFYWSLYNEHKGCNPSCGTFFHPAHNAMLAQLYEHILKDVLSQRHNYKQVR